MATTATMAAVAALGHSHSLSPVPLQQQQRRSPPAWRSRFQATRLPACSSFKTVLSVSCSVKLKGGLDIKQWNEQVYDERLQHLQSQAMDTLKKTVESFERPAFPCALILGDVVLLDLLHRLGYLEDGSVKVIFVDTFHLFPETYEFLNTVQERYKFKAHVFHAAGFNNREEYVAKHGSDLYIRVDAMINGRRRDHGAERAHLEVIQDGKMVNVQPLAYWEFRDCWNYLTKNKIPYHPLHDKGFPSVGDVQSTLPVPREKWFEYGAERSGRFQGMTNKDGSLKTECGIHSQKA